MPPDQLDVPAVPILLPLGAALMITSWVLLRRRGMLTAGRIAAAWTAGWYVIAVVGATMLPLHLTWGDTAGATDVSRIVLIPFVTMQVDDFLLNIVMTLPVAALLRIVFGVRERARVVLVTFLASAGIEFTQGVLVIIAHASRWAEVNDVIANTLGAWLGYLAFRRLMRFAPVRRTVESCSFSVREGAAR